MLRTLFIDLPCLLFDIWWMLYRLVLCAAIMIIVTLTALSLGLAWFGIRWGW